VPMKLDDALSRVAVLADLQLQALGKAATPEELEAVQRLEDIVDALSRRKEQQTVDDVGVDVTKLRRPIVINPGADEDAWEVHFANRQALENPSPVAPAFECTLCDDTGIERYVNRRMQRVATGRACRHCGDQPSDIVQVRLSSSGRIVTPHMSLSAREIEELKLLAQDGPSPAVRTHARQILTSAAEYNRPVPAMPINGAEAVRRAEEALLRQGATDGMTMMVQISDGGMRRTRPGDVLTAHMRSWLHERRADLSYGSRARQIIQAILDEEPRATGRSARRSVASTPQAAAALQSFNDARNAPSLEEVLGELEGEPTCSEPERPAQGAPKESWERRDIHYVKIGTSSDTHGVEIIRPGDILNFRQQGTLERSAALIRQSMARGRARGEQAHRLALIDRILNESPALLTSVDVDTPTIDFDAPFG
jgi:hypothetical protein